MTLDELTPWLFSRVSGGVQWGLERTGRLLAGVGDPHRLFRSVLIGGTNGKGSVAALCGAALRESGSMRIGLYTSPHLVSFTERVRIDGVPVSAELLAAAAARLRPAIEETGASFFEATTAMAFLIFAEADVDVAVVEVGLGGRLDATNVLRPMVSCVTNISMDHAEYLGDTLEQIAFEKAGIFKVGVPAIGGEPDGRLAAVLADRAAAVGAPYQHLDAIASTSDVRTGLDRTEFVLSSRHWGERRLGVALAGRHQARNAALAAETLGLLPDDVRPDWGAIEAGFGSARWSGRLQVAEVGGTTWIFDVAHNEAGAVSLAAWLAEAGVRRPRVALVAILKDKDWRPMLSALASQVDQVVLTIAPSAPASRRWDLSAIAGWFADSGRGGVFAIPEFGEALDAAREVAGDGVVVVTGSVHTVGDAMAGLGVRVGLAGASG